MNSKDVKTAPTKSLLDLVPSGPIRSKPFLFRGQTALWKVLSSSEVQQCRTAAQRCTLDVLVEEMGLEPKDAFQLLQAGSMADTEREWFEHYCIAAAMTNEHGEPISTGSPDDVAQRLIDTTSPIERGRLADDWIQFCEEHDPSSITEKQFEEIIAEAGKRGGAFDANLFASNALRSLLAITVPRMVKAEMAIAEMQEAVDLETRIEAVEHAISQINKFGAGTD